MAENGWPIMSSLYYGPVYDNHGVMSESAVNYVLDVLGFIPIVGEPADLINSLLHASAGELLFAGLSALAAIPGIGWIFTPFKWIIKIAQVVSATANFGADHEGHEDRVARSLERLSDTAESADEKKVADASIEIKNKIASNKPKIDAGLDRIEREASGSKLGKHMPQIRQALDDFVTGKTTLAPKNKSASKQLAAGYTRMSEGQLRAIVRKAMIVYS